MLTIRHFRDSDFTAVASIFDEIWGWELKGTQEEKDALATLYVAGNLMQANFVRVAEVDGKTLAVVMGKVFNASLKEGVADSLYSMLLSNARHILGRTMEGKDTLQFYKEIDAVNVKLNEDLKAKRISYQAEMLLLFVSPEAKGKGLGRQLTQSYFDFMKKEGVKTCMLHTDTHCDWEYYQKTGWKVASIRDWQYQDKIRALAFVKDVI